MISDCNTYSLFKSICIGDENAVKEIIDNRSNINVKFDDKDVTPLIQAILNKKQNKTIIKSLVNACSNINATTKNKWTALHHAVSETEPNDDLIRLLIDAGANVFSETSGYQSSIDLAIVNANKKAIQMLIDAGMDMMARNDHKDTPLHVATKYTYIDFQVIQNMIERVRKHYCDKILVSDYVNLQNNFKETPLHKILYSKNPRISIVNVLLKNGASTQMRDYKGRNAFDLAKEIKDIDIRACIQMKMQFYEK